MEIKLNLDVEEIYHLMDLLHINTQNTMEIKNLSDEQKKESIGYDNNLYAKLREHIENISEKVEEESDLLSETWFKDTKELLEDVRV